MQPFFDRLKGVQGTLVGYTGGHTDNPTYEEVSSGDTGHAEAIEITYDPKEVGYEKLLNIFWHNIDPTVENAQFVDHGTQYRSAIFYENEEQKRIAEQSKKDLDARDQLVGRSFMRSDQPGKFIIMLKNRVVQNFFQIDEWSEERV